MTIGMRCGAFQDSSQIEHAMWETPAFFLLPCYETLKNYNHLPKSRRLDVLRYIDIDSSFNVCIPNLHQNLEDGPDPNSNRSLFVCRPALSSPYRFHMISHTITFSCALRLSSEHVQYHLRNPQTGEGAVCKGQISAPPLLQL
jgi:hypothetical protein